jgi:hypothetical protein
MLNEESQEEDGNNGAVCPVPEDQLPILGNQRGQRVQVPRFNYFSIFTILKIFFF